MRFSDISVSTLIIMFFAGPLGAAAPTAEIPTKELGTKALQTAITYIKNEDPDIRILAAQVLGETGNKAATGLLKKVLGDQNKHVRIAASEALWALGDPTGLKVLYSIIAEIPAQSPIGNSPLVELKTISQNKIREKAIEAVARIKGEKAVDMLFELKNDNFGSIRDTAARELARLGYAEEMAQFLEAISNEDEGLRFEGTTILAKICNPKAVDALKDLLARERSVRVKMAALDALKCTTDKKSAFDTIIRLTDDPNPSIKFKAVGALSSIKDDKAHARLQEIYDGSNDINIKIAALKGLKMSDKKPDSEVLTRAFDSNNPDVKLEALKVVASLTDDEAKPFLKNALEDVSVNVRLATALQILKRFSKK